MTTTAERPRTRVRHRKTSAVTRTEFKARLKARRARGDGPDEALDPEVFDDWEDAADLLKHYRSAEIQTLSRASLAGTRARARPRPRTTVKTSGKTSAFAKARKVPARKKATRTAPRKKTPTRAALTLSQSVRPGVSLGPPRRFIGYRFITPEVDVRQAKFRRQRVGIGKCTGDKLKDVKRAFANSYMMLECAKIEVRKIRQNPTDARILWHASKEFEEASLSYWFGENYSQRETMTMLHKIDDILTEWSMAYCGGFRDILPVFIRCKSKNGVGGGPARHLVKNTIELFPRYFNMTRQRQTVTMLHEMGHRCKSLLKPRDERHDLCSGGWNSKENMCYRTVSEIQDDWNDIFTSGNPRILARAATDGNGSAKKTLLNNIDNYVCFMWNRCVDHGEQTLRLLSEGAKQARPKSSGKPKSKPVSKPVH